MEHILPDTGSDQPPSEAELTNQYDSGETTTHSENSAEPPREGQRAPHSSDHEGTIRLRHALLEYRWGIMVF